MFDGGRKGAHACVYYRLLYRKGRVRSVGETLNACNGLSDAVRKTACLLLYQKFTVELQVVWDNCGTMHRVIPYDAASGRMMHRTTLHGDEAIA